MIEGQQLFTRLKASRFSEKIWKEKKVNKQIILTWVISSKVEWATTIVGERGKKK